ncbi:regulatory signaling modulator protein AmpE [Pseudomonas sp. NW5]|uniref:regulatory signaling modulator protein AmpE n=1 Tax=Pseudomonas sp. NW5 TaxID=2934934 RepID=UPI0020202AEA|nr:regulatory signaling modulator protein AmpE [Pseudomonas sp. NW5]MCL7461246.1 regulatory signaling modulator protein AmpE [Pseudomonas sp. NW5]
MSFLVMLLALLLERFTALHGRIQQDALLQRFLEWLIQARVLKGHAWLALLAALLALLLPVALLLQILAPLAYGVLLVPAHVLILLWSFGRGTPLADLAALRARWLREDDQAASLHAEQTLGLRADSAPALLQQVQGYLLWQSYQGWFAVIFYYALLGPLGALGYRLVAVLGEQPAGTPGQEPAVRLRHLLDALPVRLLLLALALAGNFVTAGALLRRHLLDGKISAPQLLAEGGRAAAELPAQPLPGDGRAAVHSLEDLQHVLMRAGWIWASVLAAGVLLG